MPRLRKVQYEKYKDLNFDFEENEPIDIMKQNEIIDNFKKRNDILNSKYAKYLFRCYIIILLFINLVLITIPYYRKGLNSIFSSLACIMLFLPLLLAYSTVYKIDKSKFHEIFFNCKTIKYLLFIYSIIIIIKFIWFRINTKNDLIYILPILFTISIIDINEDNGKFNEAINELELLKYNYKEA